MVNLRRHGAIEAISRRRIGFPEDDRVGRTRHRTERGPTGEIAGGLHAVRAIGLCQQGELEIRSHAPGRSELGRRHGRLDGVNNRAEVCERLVEVESTRLRL